MFICLKNKFLEYLWESILLLAINQKSACQELSLPAKMESQGSVYPSTLNKCILKSGGESQSKEEKVTFGK